MRLGAVVLAQTPARVRPGHVEVAEGGEREVVAVRALHPGVVEEHLLDHELGAAVGVDRLLPARLRDRDLFRRRLPVGRAAAGEDDPVHARLVHRLPKAEGACRVAAVVPQRLLDRLPDVGEGSEAHHEVDRPLAQRRQDRTRVTEVGVHEREVALRLGWHTEP